MAEQAFDFQKFIDDIKNSLLKPADYFSSMAKQGGLGEPIIKALIYAAVAALVTFILGVIIPSASYGAMGGMPPSMNVTSAATAA